MSTGYSQSPDGSIQDSGPARKKMRKGTKSCLECRRRKIKCTFEDGRTAVCNECYARGSTCIDQEHGDIQNYAQPTAEQSSYSLRERVTQLEGLVKQVLDRLPENGSKFPLPCTTQDDHSGSLRGRWPICLMHTSLAFHVLSFTTIHPNTCSAISASTSLAMTEARSALYHSIPRTNCPHVAA